MHPSPRFLLLPLLRRTTRSPTGIHGTFSPRAIVLAACLGLVTGCSAQKTLLFQKTIDLPDGRFRGPISVSLPRRAAHNDHDFEIRAELRAACDPLLRVSFPDGEHASLGADETSWQELLSRRAAAGEAADPAPPPGPLPGQPGPVRLPPGHWEPVRTETWPGQLLFLEQRAERCAKVRDHHLEYLDVLDESGEITFWADTPQEILGGRITITVHAIIEAPPPPAKVVVTTHTKVGWGLPSRGAPIPPEPPPRQESPPPAEDPGAVWVPGHWTWSPGDGKWVWVYGWWQAPAQAPAPRAEDPGAPPNPGCTWAPGHWTWVSTPGKWEWTPGHWNAPPPLAETPGPRPVPESPWIPGYWVEIGGKFEWVPGRWGKPTPRVETPPAPPFPGARWIPGVWIHVKGSWVWSPGYHERTGNPPPAPRAETPPPSPGPGAVWLAGFWRWNDAKADYEWVAGHWELPPGEGYIWVADPPGPTGISIGGHWELRVRVKVDGAVKVKP